MELANTYISDLEIGRRNWNPGLIQRYKNACAMKEVVK